MPTVQTPAVELAAPAHMAVLSEKPEDAEESDPLCQSARVENMSLPGTPISTTDGSSYSSTSSTRVLLPAGAMPPPPPDDHTAA